MMKRFYKIAQATKCDGGWTVLLDGRAVRTPAKSAFVAPTEALAAASASEWVAQETDIRPNSMPITKSINTALDRTGPEFGQVVEMIAAYGGSDLICYRAEAPKELIERQAKAWNPLISWVETRYGAALTTTPGVMPTAQVGEGQRLLFEAVRTYSPFALTAVYDLVALSGSLVIGLATAEGKLNAEEGWALSRVDETWQQDQWGIDDDAAATANIKRGEFSDAVRFLSLLD
jgi:chaperone required for assembly of F1-ATPase